MNIAAITREAVGNAHGLYVVVLVIDHESLSVFTLNGVGAVFKPLPFMLMRQGMKSHR